MGQTFVQKIMSRKAGRGLQVGEIVELEPDVAMSHDNTAAISKTFYKIGVDRVYDPDKHVIILDHCVPAANATFALNHKEIREFVAKQGIENFFDIETGICHQVMIEKGFALPGRLVVGADSHSTTYGAVGAFGAEIGRSEMAVIMATGRIWLRVPETLKIVVDGEFATGVGSKDLMLKVIGTLGADGGLYRAVEFTGPTMHAMSVASRTVLPNMGVEFGVKIAYIPPDEIVFDYLEGRASAPVEPLYSDDDAEFEAVHTFDVTDLPPQIAKPHTIDRDTVVDVTEVRGTRIDQIMFGSCTNARLEDFEVVAGILKGKKVHPGTRMLVFPASREVLLEAMRLGYIEALAEAGAILNPTGCGPCMGNHLGVPAEGEVVLSTSNRNFRGRMGNREADVYLASPRTVAWSALSGRIEDAREHKS